jgi:transcriptional regulator with XRE-family HTH domain
MAGIHRRVTTMPYLAEQMEAKGITYLALAEQAGVTKGTVWKAKMGNTVLVGTALIIQQTIDTRF